MGMSIAGGGGQDGSCQAGPGKARQGWVAGIGIYLYRISYRTNIGDGDGRGEKDGVGR